MASSSEGATVTMKMKIKGRRMTGLTIYLSIVFSYTHAFFVSDWEPSS